MFEMPFMVLLVLATNLKPTELADEAFLRRIQYQIYAESPTVDDYRRIFENDRKTSTSRTTVRSSTIRLRTYYRPNRIELRGCQPRDSINQALALASYLGQPARLTPELMDTACRNYL